MKYLCKKAKEYWLKIVPTPYRGITFVAGVAVLIMFLAVVISVSIPR